MTTYFTAPDGHGEPTLWAPDPDRPDFPQPIMRRCDLSRGQQDHWDELVARVIAGNPPTDSEPPPAEKFNAITDWREPVPGWSFTTGKTPGSAIIERWYDYPEGN